MSGAAADDRNVYLDGGNHVQQTDNSAPANLDRAAIGQLYQDGSWYYPMSGTIALPCIWDVALSPDEIAALGAGAHPLMIRPDNIVAFWPLNTL